jgi:hypothetical protein
MATNAINPNSRYANLDTAQFALSDTRSVVYLRRRFVPPSSAIPVAYEHTVRDGDRLDLIAATYLNDSEQFWRIADANDAMDPAELIPPASRPKVLVTQSLPVAPAKSGAKSPEVKPAAPQAPARPEETMVTIVAEAPAAAAEGQPQAPLPKALPAPPAPPVTVALIKPQVQRLRIPMVASDAIVNQAISFSPLPDAGD